MRLLSAYHEGLPHSLTVDYPSSETCGTKGSALCGALPSTPPVERVGERTQLLGCRHCHGSGSITILGAFLAAECHSPGCMILRFCLLRDCCLYLCEDSCSLPSPLGLGGGGLGTLFIYKLF